MKVEGIVELCDLSIIFCTKIKFFHRLHSNGEKKKKKIDSLANIKGTRLSKTPEEINFDEMKLSSVESSPAGAQQEAIIRLCLHLRPGEGPSASVAQTIANYSCL